MKIEKKTIIIIIVVAVVAYLLWKRMKGSSTVTLTETVVGSSPDKTSLDYILSHVNFTSDERKKIESYRQSCETSNTTRQSIEAKAYEKGRSFDQQLALDAIWVLYTKNGQWIAGPNGKTTYGWNLQQKVLNL